MTTIKIIIICFLCHSFCFSQTNKLQPIGSMSTHLIDCPCKLFKYYEDYKVYYHCVDRGSKIEYTIRQFQHKDLIDLVIQSFKTLSSKKAQSRTGGSNYLSEYLKLNSNGLIIDFLNQEAVLVNNENEKKLFFSSKDEIVSYEIIVGGENIDLSAYFQKIIGSIISKKEDFKSNF